MVVEINGHKGDESPSVLEEALIETRNLVEGVKVELSILNFEVEDVFVVGGLAFMGDSRELGHGLQLVINMEATLGCRFLCG